MKRAWEVCRWSKWTRAGSPVWEFCPNPHLRLPKKVVSESILCKSSQSPCSRMVPTHAPIAVKRYTGGGRIAGATVAEISQRRREPIDRLSKSHVLESYVSAGLLRGVLRPSGFRDPDFCREPIVCDLREKSRDPRPTLVVAHAWLCGVRGGGCDMSSVGAT